MRKVITLLFLLCLYGMARGQTVTVTGYDCECEVDGKQVIRTTMPAGGGKYSEQIDLSSLPSGLHRVRARITQHQSDGVAAIAMYDAICYRLPAAGEHHVTATCLVDGVQFKSETVSRPQAWMLDLSELPTGLHNVRVEVADRVNNNAATTAVYEAVCYRIPLSGEHHVTATCLVDGVEFKSETVTGPQAWMLDLSELPTGLHNVRVEVADRPGLGAATKAVFETMCYRVPPATAATRDVSVAYRVDGVEVKRGVIKMNSAAEVATLDLSSLPTGLHNVEVWLSDATGFGNTAVYSAMAYRTEGQISSYEYWVNDLPSSHRRVTLSQPVESYSLVSLLPVASVPVRSAKFRFEIENGTPRVYACNDIRVRFGMTGGGFRDVHGDFVDYTQWVAVNAEALHSGDHKTFPRPLADDIKWYVLESGRGDSLRFKVDKACTMQLFGPDGKEVYAADGLNSVQWGGVTVWQAGKYYLALHDVSAANAATVSLDYELIDHYSILRQNVTTVGNAGITTITYDGNGFDSLDSMRLVHGSTVLKSLEIRHISNSRVEVSFDFTDCELGKYTLTGYFDDETRVRRDNITVEEATPPKITINIIDPGTFVINRPTKPDVTVKNDGNTTASGVPTVIRIRSGSATSVRSVKFGGNVPPIDLSWLEEYAKESEEARQLYDAMKSMGDGNHFVTFHDEETGEYLHTAVFVCDIAPKSEVKIDMEIVSSDDYTIEAYTPEEWFYDSAASDGSRGNMGPSWCKNKDKVQCIVSAIGTIAGLATTGLPVASCAISVGVTIFNNAYDIACDPHPKFTQRLGANMKSIVPDVFMTSLSCFLGFKKFDEIKTVVEGIMALANGATIGYDMGGTFNSCVRGFAGGKTAAGHAVASLDPNEIEGYQSPAGTLDLGRDVESVNYTIRFENDTLATAPASVVVLTDTIDGTVHDLHSFAPSRVKIGNHSEALDGTPNFVKTIDLRPEIYCVAQVECDYDESTGIARWTLSSLDPMTMEPITDYTQGLLPVNTDGTGEGEVTFNIGLKPGLADGTEVRSRAGIKFDNNDVIMTNEWVNVVDAVAPVSTAVNFNRVDDNVATVEVSAVDNRSGVWHYNVEVQYGAGTEWHVVALDVEGDSIISVPIFDGVSHRVRSIAVDYAGNHEVKQGADIVFNYNCNGEDVNGDKSVDVGDVNAILQNILSGSYDAGLDVNNDGRVDVGDVNAILASILRQKARRR